MSQRTLLFFSKKITPRVLFHEDRLEFAEIFFTVAKQIITSRSSMPIFSIAIATSISNSTDRLACGPPVAKQLITSRSFIPIFNIAIATSIFVLGNELRAPPPPRIFLNSGATKSAVPPHGWTLEQVELLKKHNARILSFCCRATSPHNCFEGRFRTNRATGAQNNPS